MHAGAVLLTNQGVINWKVWITKMYYTQENVHDNYWYFMLVYYCHKKA